MPRFAPEERRHAEVVRVHFDPAVISYGELLEVFFTAHDPTTVNRQGNDVGTQYRSVIFVLNDEQRAEAERVIAGLEARHVFAAPVVTTVEQAGSFWKAEDYHQNYFANNSPSALLLVCSGSQDSQGSGQVRRPG